MTWVKLGEGTYNTAYCNGDLVFKIAKGANAVDAAERAVRVWNEVNAHLQPPAYVADIEIDGQIYHGWVCPFVEGIQSTDDEISSELKNMYERKGRVVVDALSPRNFITTPEGQVVCVDVGLALQLEQHETADLNQLRRRPSIDSLAEWTRARELSFHKYNTDWDPIYPRTVRTMKALLFIKKYRPDIDRLDFLFEKRILDLAKAYDLNQLSDEIDIDCILMLAQECPVDIEHTKGHCKNILENFMQFKFGNIVADPQEQAGLNVLQLIAAATSVAEIVAAFKTEDFNVLVKRDEGASVNIEKPLQTQKRIDIADIENDKHVKFDAESVLKELNQLDFDSDSESDEEDHTTGSDSSEEEKYTIEPCLQEVFLAFKLQCINILKNKITKQPSKSYKKQLLDDKWETQVKLLIDKIERAVTLEDIDHCLLDFEEKHPITASSDLDQVRLSNKICQCKLTIGSAMRVDQLRPNASFEL